MTCHVEKCERPVRAKGLCNAHYIRARHGRPLEAALQLRDPGRRCEVEGCAGTHHSGGLCNSHSARFRRHADPTAGGPYISRHAPAVDRILAACSVSDDALVSDLPCWLTAGNRADGRRRVSLAGGAQDYAYRLVYEELIGEIPLGLTLDHLCCRPSCVNPWHLDPVTLAENTRRMALQRWRA